MISSVDNRLEEEPAPIPEKFQRLRLLVPATEEDRIVADLGSLGTLGLECRQAAGDKTELLVYFASPVQDLVLDLMEGRQEISGAELVDVTEVTSEDWNRQYRRLSRPFAVGTGWWVDPREPLEGNSEPPGQRRLLRIPARTAFGTGSHASTALAVELMEEVQFAGKRILDVGTGTGILAMVALASGAESVTAIDTDPVATFVARETCGLNGLHPRFLAGGLAVIRACSPARTFDVIVANVLPHRLQSDYPYFPELLRQQGVLILSGLLQSQQTDVVSAMEDLGLRYQSHRDSGEWVGLHMEKATS